MLGRQCCALSTQYVHTCPGVSRHQPAPLPAYRAPRNTWTAYSFLFHPMLHTAVRTGPRPSGSSSVRGTWRFAKAVVLCRAGHSRTKKSGFIAGHVMDAEQRGHGWRLAAASWQTSSTELKSTRSCVAFDCRHNVRRRGGCSMNQPSDADASWA